eukprot:CAMPEP_0114686274 /NCGR_PEP_ID=MMETSP0191-20121206/61336_1 /TAXON_ID=126664 /ORGANISM="Sorites sp." /LENGTH=33 /DNA_ID= /DNA_START= /DNA_END= /DNA_ORIENTATION=
MHNHSAIIVDLQGQPLFELRMLRRREKGLLLQG